MSNLALRLLTAAVGLPLVVALVAWREPLGFGLLVLLAAVLALVEYTGVTLSAAPGRLRVAVVVLGAALGTAVYLRPELALVWTIAAFVAVSAAVLLDPGEIAGAGTRLGAAVFGVFYLGMLPVPLALLHRDAADGSLWVLLAIAVTFGNDTGAYFAGRHRAGGTRGDGAAAHRRGLRAGRGSGWHARASRGPGRVAAEAGGGGQGLRAPAPGPRRHARPHRCPAVRGRLGLRLRGPHPLTTALGPCYDPQNGKTPAGISARVAKLKPSPNMNLKRLRADLTKINPGAVNLGHTDRSRCEGGGSKARKPRRAPLIASGGAKSKLYAEQSGCADVVELRAFPCYTVLGSR
jgi:hypothetical protein